MSELAERLAEEFGDAEYAHAYLEEHGNLLLAAQIKVIREQRGWTQKELAKRAGMLQARISALENVEYDAWTVNTLRKLAKAFDVGLNVSFVPVSDAIMSVVNVTGDRLRVAPRAESLETLKRHKVIFSGNNWKAIDTSHVAPVVEIVEGAGYPANPAPGWQRLKRPCAG